MDGSNLVLIVVPVFIPLVLAIGIALPLIASRDTARAFSPSRPRHRAPQPGADLRVTQPMASHLGDLPLLCGQVAGRLHRRLAHFLAGRRQLGAGRPANAAIPIDVNWSWASQSDDDGVPSAVSILAAVTWPLRCPEMRAR